MNLERWRLLMTRLTLPESPDVYHRLVDAYSESQRHYHTKEHVDDCLEQLDSALELADRPDEVELALWFHDAVYRTSARDNELQSANWAAALLRAAKAPEEQCRRVHELVMATKHDALPQTGDAALVVDIDLSILGRAPDVFDRFEVNIRREYRWVPGPLYRRKRREILSSFLKRPHVFSLAPFRDRFEQPARDNLQRAMEELS